MIEAFIRGDNRPRPAGRRPSIRAIPSSGQLGTFREPNRKLRAWFHSAKTAPERRARCILEGRIRSKMIAMKSKSAAREFPIVCVGGSAGGLDGYTRCGSPFTPFMQVNNSYSLSSNNLWYPNLVGDPKAVAGGQSIDSWFNVNAFASPTPGTFGNLGRNTLYGPGLSAINMSLHKVFKFTERMNLDFSANATNLTNHPSFALPDKAIGAGHVGRISGTSVGSRQMELVAKFRF